MKLTFLWAGQQFYLLSFPLYAKITSLGANTRIVWALKVCGGGGKGWCKNLARRKYTLMYKKGIKKTHNKSMETTFNLKLNNLETKK